MDAQRVLEVARSGSAPRDWYVWPLRRDRVRRAALGWGAITAFGFILLVPLVLITVPSNFNGGAGLIFLTLLLLGLVGAVAFGGASLLVGDVRRLLRLDAYMLVITPEHYLKAEAGRMTFIPMTAVAYVTLKGVKVAGAPPQSSMAQAAVGRFGALGAIGGGYRLGGRREINRAPSLAFLDVRTDTEVVVATDDTYEELPVLAEVLNLYARGVPRRS
jgi:hypothetical protein